MPSLTKTLLYLTKDSCADRTEICIAKERRGRKNTADRKKGVVREIPASPSAVFRGVSYLLHPGHEYELGPSRSGIGLRPISSMLVPWATLSFAAAGLATALFSVIIPRTTHRRFAPSFREARYSSSYIPRTVLSATALVVQCASRPAGGEGCAREVVFGSRHLFSTSVWFRRRPLCLPLDDQVHPVSCTPLATRAMLEMPRETHHGLSRFHWKSRIRVMDRLSPV